MTLIPNTCKIEDKNKYIKTCRYGPVYSVSKWITEIDGNITDQQLTRRMKQN